VPTSLLRNLNIYSGARGIYTDADMTAGVAPDGGAVTLSFLHTGKIYADELSADGVVYHYPETGQPGKDRQEIAATKAAAEVFLPIFVITTSQDPTRRDVRRGWVTGWDDSSSVFMVAFADDQPPSVPPVDSVDGSPFRLTGSPPEGTSVVPTRPGQARFKFEVFRRYGAACTVCGLDIDGLLDAAHIRDKRYNGSDDPRNGIVLCALHHRAMDRGLFGIRPNDRSIQALPMGPSLSQLGIKRADLNYLERGPHEKALDWRWKQWLKVAKVEDPHAADAPDKP
jgi:putative restriction endonuclease